MKFLDYLARYPFILSEAAVCERLRRMPDVRLDPELFNAPLVYDPHGSQRLAAIYLEYIEIARARELPLLLAAPSWRLDRERVQASVWGASINRDVVAFIEELREASGYDPVLLAGLLAARHDSYDFSRALGVAEAERFHAWQVGELAASGVDCLIAQTIPSVKEAEGMARAMVGSGVPSVIGFCINRKGEVLDGTPLEDAIERLDERLQGRLAGFMVNCSHPTFVAAERMSDAVRSRLLGIAANASSKDHSALEAAGQSEVDSIEEWADAMLTLHRAHGVRILGGCCGTHAGHLTALCQGIGSA